MHLSTPPPAPAPPPPHLAPVLTGDVGGGGGRFPLLAPASGRSAGIFSSLGRVRVRQAQVFEVALSALPPEFPAKGLRSPLSGSAEAAGNVYNRNQALESLSTDFLPISIL